MQTDQTYLLVGTVTKDLLADGNFTIGGTVTYAAVIAKNLGWQPIIVTTAALDFKPPSYLADVDWRILPSSETTTFHNTYDAYGHRRQIVGPIAQAITSSDIPADCQQAPLVHLCPLAQDLTPSITSIFKNSLLMATPQGWIRQWNKDGVVSLGKWISAAQVLPQLKAAVISLEDIADDWTIAKNWATQIPVLIVTEGEKGCAVFHQGQMHTVPPRPAEQVDPTGAGDVFAAAFFIRFYETGDLWQSARFANVTASMTIERQGPESAPSRNEIERYLAVN